jgi:Domain of unknown function (DUF5069)
MNSPLIRSPRFTTGGLFCFARILDKIRLNAEGKLPEGYNLGVMPNNRTFDDRVCCFLQIDFQALSQRTLAGGTDEEILEWCFQNGQRPSEEQLFVFNSFISKRGWRDGPASESLQKQKEAAGFGQRDDIQTYFDLIEAEEA